MHGLTVSPPEAVMVRLHLRDWLAEHARAPSITRPLRENQRPPDGDWLTWLLLAGRGYGKSLAGATDVATYGRTNPGSRIAIVAPTYADARDTCVEGES